MKNVSILLAFLLLGFKNSNAQTCTISYSVAFSDGKTVQVGLTAEQKKFLEGDGTKRYKGICLNPANPDYLILWTEGLSERPGKSDGRRGNQRARPGETTSTPSGSARLNAPGNSSGWLESLTIKRSSVCADKRITGFSTTQKIHLKSFTMGKDIKTFRRIAGTTQGTQ